MSGQKTRDDIGAAIRHLMHYAATTEPWTERENQVLDEFFAPVADVLDRELNDVAASVLSGPHAPMALAFAFEESATVHWGNEGESLIDVYLAARGWREKPGGRRFLQALNASETGFWEVVAVEPGHSIDVRPYGVGGKAVRVQERSGSESVRVYDALAARVVTVGGTRMFAGSVLSYSPESTRRAELALKDIPDELRETYDDMLAAGDIDAVPENLDEEIADELRSRLPGVLFAEWALGVLGAYARPLNLANTDGDPLMPTRARFPIRATSEEIAATLSKHALLSAGDDSTWTWLAPADDGDDTGRRTMLGTFTLRDTHLELATNSAERAQEGEAVLRDALGAGLGAGLAVHETADATLEGTLRSGGPMPTVPDARGEGTAGELVKNHLDAHNRRTLDEPIPMLGHRTLRECAADPDGRRDVLVWLKSLESTSARMPPGPAGRYDFARLWAELGLEDQR